MSKTQRNLISNYTFNAAAKTVTLPSFTTVELKRLVSIINVTRGVIYYKAGDVLLVPTIATNTITLNASVFTTGHANTDDIHIAYVEDDLGIVPAHWRSTRKWIISTASTQGNATAWNSGTPTFAIRNTNTFPVRMISLELCARNTQASATANNQNLPIQASIYKGITAYAGGTGLAVTDAKTYVADSTIVAAFMPTSPSGSGGSFPVGDGNMTIVPYTSSANLPAPVNPITAPKWAEGLIIPAGGMLVLQGQPGFGGATTTSYCTLTAVITDELL